MTASKPVSSLGITEDEWRNELDRLRSEPRNPGFQMSDEQFRFLDYARTNGRAVPWSKIRDLWEKYGWSKFSSRHLAVLYEREKEIRNAST